MRLLGNDLTERVLTLVWTYNTTNDPFVPTRGTFLRFAPFRTMRDRTTPHSVPVRIGGLPRFDVIADHTNANVADVTGFRYWELAEINSVSGGLAGQWANVDERRHPLLAGAPDSDGVNRMKCCRAATRANSIVLHRRMELVGGLIEVPPLRARRDDIPLLFSTFLQQFCTRNQRLPLSATPVTLEVLSAYDWPGNVRELRNVAERLSVFGTDPITVDQLPRSRPSRSRYSPPARRSSRFAISKRSARRSTSRQCCAVRTGT